MSKKRHTRAPYEIHNLEDIIKKDIPVFIPAISFSGALPYVFDAHSIIQI